MSKRSTLTVVIGHEGLSTNTVRPRALHLVSGLEPGYGGPSYSVPRLCGALARCGAAITLLSVNGSNKNPPGSPEHEYEDKRFPQACAHIPAVRALRLSSGLLRELRESAPRADIVHNHGLWLAPNLYAAREASRSGRPFVVSPRGMLNPTALSYSRLKKRIFWQTFQKKAVRDAACIHATSNSEYEEVRALGLGNPVAVIPNGVDVPEISKDIHALGPKERVLLALGRIHPKKGFDRLLRAWGKVETALPDWRLRVVGPAELGHEKELQALVRSLELKRVSIEGAVYGDQKNAAYREADLFVLPSLHDTRPFCEGGALVGA